ncbi:hypothetical protein G9274_001377 [Stenotrophomonas rhizophila]|nr:hypothetical protein G9274_001377 [Stenotrophomonas rhizophila]
MWWDGGDRAITAREKATIEEHGPSCYTIPLLPAQAADPADPWRGLYLPARMPAPSEYGDLSHPDIPLWPDQREDALDKLVHAQGFDFQIVAGEFTYEAMDDGDELYWQEMRAWSPAAPEGDWRLAWKGDTEDGPYAWFVRPMALRPELVASAVSQHEPQEPAQTWTSFQTLEVGRTYQLRSGGEIEITAHSGNPNKPFKSSHGSNYRSDGRYYGSDDSCLDLVKVRVAGGSAQGVVLPYSLDADPAGIRARVADVITGTLMVGAQGHTPPPAGHWAEPFWKMARADAAAQGIDLGQQQDAARWRWVREQSGVTVSVEEADDDGDLAFVSGHTPAELDAAIDSLRDAAPGVDRG